MATSNKYNFMATQVDVKATNLHGSGLADTVLSTNYNGVTTEIPVGSVVIPGTDSTPSLDVAGAGATNALGIVTESRTAGDVRPVTYTYFGWVRVLADTSAILVGSKLKCGATGKVTLADPSVVSGGGTVNADAPLVIGKALEANGGASKIIQALVWFG